MQGVNQNHFAQVPEAEILRSSFDRSHGYKTTFQGGLLVPFFLDEALPGDTFNLNSAGYVRLATPIYPVMDNMYLETFFFAVPNRLIWDNWQKMMGEQTDPGDSTDFLVPTITQAGQYTQNTLADYLGLPTYVTGVEHNALPFRAYNLIYNEWFRDQNLQNSLDVPKNDGPDATSQYSLQNRGKRHDYFCSALPWPQKGPSIDIPLGTTAPVLGIGTVAGAAYGGPPASVNVSDLTVDSFSTYLSNQLNIRVEEFGTTGFPAIRTDLTNATAATINQLRQAFQIQKMYERDARGGTRYIEVIKSHFGVTSPDARLQRPEFLGGGRSNVNITPLAATAATTDRDLGGLSAVGTASFQGHGFTKSFTEHCYIIGLVNVRADLTYQQGMDRLWSRQDRLDFYWPALAQIGEQEILNKEIYYQGTADDNLVFGYQERFAEYRYKPSIITGEFRSVAPTSLDAWHLSQEFTTLPTLGDTFIKDAPPIDRVIATPAEPQFIGDFFHNLRCARPMPLFGVPGNMDRF